VPDAPSGHAYPNLQFFLFGRARPGRPARHIGAVRASFALLARLTGLPSRVVVGFDVPASGTVTAADAIAWPEVLFTDLGWVPFDPMPRAMTPPVEADFSRPAADTRHRRRLRRRRQRGAERFRAAGRFCRRARVRPAGRAGGRRRFPGLRC
jgi:hypothetical protein